MQNTCCSDWKKSSDTTNTGQACLASAILLCTHTDHMHEGTPQPSPEVKPQIPRRQYREELHAHLMSLSRIPSSVAMLKHQRIQFAPAVIIGSHLFPITIVLGHRRTVLHLGNRKLNSALVPSATETQDVSFSPMLHFLTRYLPTRCHI